MKSKINTTSFFRETMRNHKWMMLVITLLTFAILPLQFLLSLTQWEGDAYIADYVRKYFVILYTDSNNFSSNTQTLLLLVLFIGVALGVWAFAYLHSQVQVSLYHSIPISRKELMITKFVASSLCFVVPLFVANVLFLIILTARGFFTWLFIGQMLVIFYYSVMMFWMGYLLAAIAMLLTGKVFIGVFGALTFILYCPILAYALQVLVNAFCYTSYSENYYVWGNFEILGRISPWTCTSIIQCDSIWMAILTLVVVVVLWVIHQWLMGLRQSEAAGNAMAYKLAGRVIQFFLIVIFTLGIAVIAYQSAYKEIWLYIGGVIGWMVSLVITQLLYGVEFKKMFYKNVIVVIVAGVIGMGTVACIHQDVFGYDSYLPEYENLTDINIEFTEGNQYSTKYVAEGIYEAHMGVDEETYELMQLIIESSDNVNRAEDRASIGQCVYIYVEYHLENGKVIQREYEPMVADIEDALKGLWENEEFLNIMYPIRTQDLSLVKGVFLTEEEKYWEESSVINEDTDLAEGLMAAYQKDALAITAATLEETPISMLYYTQYREGVGVYYSDNYNVFIYPSFTNTLEFLEANDVELPDVIDANDVASLGIYEVSEEEEVSEEGTAYRDNASISMVLEDIRNINCVTIFSQVDDTKWVDVVFEDAAMNEEGNLYVILTK